MALIKEVRGFTPEIGENTYLAENAVLYIADYIMNYSEYMEQLKNEDQNGAY